LRGIFLLIRIRIRIVAVLNLLPVDITGSQVKHLECGCGLASPARGGDVIALIAFVTFIFVIPAAPWHPEMQFVIRAIDVYRDVWFSFPISGC
jgi:hypothetical protein